MYNFSENPFRLFRAEQITKDLWKFYEPLPNVIMVPRPLVLEGGRGSGKTMFFLCNSWQERISTLEAEGEQILSLLDGNNFVGIYWKVDGRFVRYMDSDSRKDWDHVFATYMGVCQVQEILEFLKLLINNNICSEKDLSHSFNSLKKLIDKSIEINSISDALNVCDSVLDEIQYTLNSPKKDLSNIKLSITGLIIDNFVKGLRLLPQFKETTFRFFIDEYETLHISQQRIVNTLIKQSDGHLIYSIGLRPNGMKTHQTINESEVIQDPHDYSLIRLEHQLNDVEQSEYQNILKKICERRLNIFAEQTNHKNVIRDIEWYLGNYDINYELKQLESYKALDYINELKELIRQYEINEETVNKYIKVLVDEAPILNSRLHLCLLRRNGKYKPKLDYLLSEYENWTQHHPTKNYSEWMKHTRFGLIFLLCGDLGKSKTYFGMEVFTELSSGVIRYFLELCEKAFDFALMKEFSWDSPRKLTPEEQNRASRFVSRNKIKDIEEYEPYGKQLRIFVENLGEIFRQYHQNKYLTLGQPEINHFSTDFFKISGESKAVLDSAIMWTVLQDEEASKDRDELPQNVYDFILNRIYCPYFQISYRKFHKLDIPPEFLDKLLSGNIEKAQEVTKHYIQKLNFFKTIDTNQGLLFEDDQNV